MKERCFVGLDLGTTFAKSIALSSEGRVLASAACPVASTSPGGGRAQQEAEALWRAAASCLRETSAALGAAVAEALGLSGAMHSCLPVGGDGKPLAPAMTWADQRAAETCRALRLRADLDRLYRRTGCPLQPIYHVAKLRWWKEAEPGVRAACFVTLKDYVLRQLVGEWLGDLSIWSATGLLDIRECRWDEEALELAGVGADHLPPLASPLWKAGRLTPAAAKATGLPAGLPVITGASDGALANLGCGAALPGQSTITVGTSGAVRRVTAEPSLDDHPSQRTWCYLLTPGRWFAGGAVNNAGLAVQWVRERLYPEGQGDEAYARLFHEASEVRPGAEGVMCLPFFTGERSPYWRADARAAFAGLSWSHGPRHLARAVLEAVAFRLADVWQALTAPQSAEPARLTGRILQTPGWAQILCDVLGVELDAVDSADASVTGAALLAQAALDPGVPLERLAGRVQPQKRWRPEPQRHEVYQRLLEEFRELYRQIIDITSDRGYA